MICYCKFFTCSNKLVSNFKIYGYKNSKQIKIVKYSTIGNKTKYTPLRIAHSVKNKIFFEVLKLERGFKYKPRFIPTLVEKSSLGVGLAISSGLNQRTVNYDKQKIYPVYKTPKPRFFDPEIMYRKKREIPVKKINYFINYKIKKQKIYANDVSPEEPDFIKIKKINRSRPLQPAKISEFKVTSWPFSGVRPKSFAKRFFIPKFLQKTIYSFQKEFHVSFFNEGELKKLTETHSSRIIQNRMRALIKSSNFYYQLQYFFMLNQIFWFNARRFISKRKNKIKKFIKLETILKKKNAYEKTKSANFFFENHQNQAKNFNKVKKTIDFNKKFILNQNIFINFKKYEIEVNSTKKIDNKKKYKIITIKKFWKNIKEYTYNKFFKIKYRNFKKSGKIKKKISIKIQNKLIQFWKKKKKEFINKFENKKMKKIERFTWKKFRHFFKGEIIKKKKSSRWRPKKIWNSKEKNWETYTPTMFWQNEFIGKNFRKTMKTSFLPKKFNKNWSIKKIKKWILIFQLVKTSLRDKNKIKKVLKNNYIINKTKSQFYNKYIFLFNLINKNRKNISKNINYKIQNKFNFEKNIFINNGKIINKKILLTKVIETLKYKKLEDNNFFIFKPFFYQNINKRKNIIQEKLQAAIYNKNSVFNKNKNVISPTITAYYTQEKQNYFSWLKEMSFKKKNWFNYQKKYNKRQENKERNMNKLSSEEKILKEQANSYVQQFEYGKPYIKKVPHFITTKNQFDPNTVSKLVITKQGISFLFFISVITLNFTKIYNNFSFYDKIYSKKFSYIIGKSSGFDLSTILQWTSWSPGYIYSYPKIKSFWQELNMFEWLTSTKQKPIKRHQWGRLSFSAYSSSITKKLIRFTKYPSRFNNIYSNLNSNNEKFLFKQPPFNTLISMLRRNQLEKFIHKFTILVTLVPRRNNVYCTITILPKPSKKKKQSNQAHSKIFHSSAGMISHFKGMERRSRENRKKLYETAAFSLLRFHKKNSRYLFIGLRLKYFYETIRTRKYNLRKTQNILKNTLYPFTKKQISSRYPLIWISMKEGYSNFPRGQHRRSKKHKTAAKRRSY